MTSRRYRLSPWLVRTRIPEDVTGVYVVWSPSAPVYVGRSDTSLRELLLKHARTWPDIFFTFDVARSPEDASRMEDCLMHALGNATTGVDIPQRDTEDDPGLALCPNCLVPLLEYRSRHLDAIHNPPETHPALQADMKGISA